MLAEIKATAENRMTKQQANLTLTLQNNDEMKYKRERECCYHFSG
jgi:hypothetical protein